jgi:hypothetical protein
VNVQVKVPNSPVGAFSLILRWASQLNAVPSRPNWLSDTDCRGRKTEVISVRTINDDRPCPSHGFQKEELIPSHGARAMNGRAVRGRGYTGHGAIERFGDAKMVVRVYVRHLEHYPE